MGYRAMDYLLGSGVSQLPIPISFFSVVKEITRLFFTQRLVLLEEENIPFEEIPAMEENEEARQVHGEVSMRASGSRPCLGTKNENCKLQISVKVKTVLHFSKLILLLYENTEKEMFKEDNLQGVF